MLDLHLARFDLDVVPPPGHSLCGGWIKPVEAVDDPLKLRGIVLLGAGPPIVLAAIDWTGLMNESHREFTEILADAAGTTADRVALHTVHQHNAPFVDRTANEMLVAAGASRLIHEPKYVADVAARARAAVVAGLAAQQPVTHVRIGRAKVEQVACNRRVVGPDGKIRFTRTSATRDPAARAEPEGTIDPTLRSISFLQKERPLARLYHYAVHPMSYYGDGRVSSDFVGLARLARDRDEPDTLHVYFTGAAGNVTAGKYNDGSKPMRAVLTQRIHEAMVAADSGGRLARLEDAGWSTLPVDFLGREDLDLDALRAIVADPDQSVVNRNRSALTASWLIRRRSGRPILLSKLDLPGGSILHLPGETFVEYQLFAQSLARGNSLSVAAYGDDGPWYIPLRRSYAEGGYEPSVSFVSSRTEETYRAAIERLVRPDSRVRPLSS
ncbi:MAG: hypothetical protein SFX72_10510 [Isosphaeraceae bacterium]|nr:hypothetical protein [Isosphaeraceae bacterium]